MSVLLTTGVWGWGSNKKDANLYFIAPSYDTTNAERDAVETEHYYHTHIATPREILGKTPPTAVSTTVKTPQQRILVRGRNDDNANNDDTPSAPRKRQRTGQGNNTADAVRHTVMRCAMQPCC